MNLNMIVSSNAYRNNKLSWFKTDIGSISSLDEFPYFSILKIFNSLLINSYFLLLVVIKFYSLKFNDVYSQQYETIQKIITFNPQKAILIGTSISLLISLLTIGSLIKSYFSIKLSYIPMPKFVRKDNYLSLIYSAIKAPEIVPKGFDVMLSTAFGVFGIFLFLFLFMVNEEDIFLSTWLLFLLDYSTIFYCMMQSVYIAFNFYSIINSAILFTIILLLPRLFNIRLISDNYEQTFIFWLPIIVLYLMPLIINKLRRKKI